jgi:hypothetical protein
MKTPILFCSTILCSFAFAAAQGANAPASDPGIPHLQKHGTATQLIVDGKPFLMLAGELGNNSATSLDYMKKIWPNLVQANFNTVLVGVSWDQIEPQEGKFDFAVLDGVIQGAREHNLHLALLWFGSWKNSLSSYAPDWVKKDFTRFPRCQFEGGVSIEELTTLSDANRDADAGAFAALMKHVKQVDGSKHTVIFIQVENEVGMHTVLRDHCPAAEKALAGQVPKELMDYLQLHKDTLIPEFRQVWEKAGFKTSGTWEEVFGKGDGKDSVFMAWNYARYIGRVAEAGKAEYPIPMYVNAALYSPGKTPEFTPSHGRPWDLVMDIWHAGGPKIDVLSPDIYGEGTFVAFCERYTQSGNPLLIPETGAGAAGAAKAFYAFGRHDAICFSPFGIDRISTNDPIVAAYGLLSQLAPLILEHQGNGTMSAVMMEPTDPAKKVPVGNYTLTVTPSRPRGAAAPTPARGGGGMRGGGAGEATPAPQAAPLTGLFIAAGPDEYYMVGNGLTVTFSSNTPGAPLAGMGTIQEGAFEKGHWVPGRWLAGDDTSQGDYLNLRNMGIIRLTVYSYK